MIDLNEKVLSLGKEHHQLISKILSSSTHPYMMTELLEKILSNNSLSFKNKEEILHYVSEALGDKQAYYSAYVGAYCKLCSEKMIEAVRIISKSKGENQAYHATDIVVDEDMIDKNETLELATAISQSLGKYQAYYGAKVAKGVKNSDIVVPLTIITCGATEYFQAERAAKVALDPDVLESDKALFFTDVVSRSKNENIAKETCRVATSSYISNDKKVLELRRIFKMSS